VRQTTGDQRAVDLAWRRAQAILTQLGQEDAALFEATVAACRRD
jgi:hypothetical protein